MDTTFNLFDLSFIFGLIIFIALAFFRGFVREIFALLNWVISTFLTIFLSDLIAKLLKSFLPEGFVLQTVSLIASFIVVFIVVTIFTRKFGTIIKEKIPYTTDQVLGVAYAFLKTFLIFGLVYSFAVNGHGLIYGNSSKTKHKESMPAWLYNSKFKSVISPFGNALDPVTKAILGRISPKFNFKARKNDEKQDSSGFLDIFKSKGGKIEKLEAYGVFDENEERDSEKNEVKGYDKRQIQKMDRLIEIIE